MSIDNMEFLENVEDCSVSSDVPDFEMPGLIIRDQSSYSSSSSHVRNDFLEDANDCLDCTGVLEVVDP